MDQATFTDQVLLRNQPQCRQSSNLDRNQRLPACGHYEEANENRSFALHNSTDFERVRFRENARFTGV